MKGKPHTPRTFPPPPMFHRGPVNIWSTCIRRPHAGGFRFTGSTFARCPHYPPAYGGQRDPAATASFEVNNLENHSPSPPKHPSPWATWGTLSKWAIPALPPAPFLAPPPWNRDGKLMIPKSPLFAVLLPPTVSFFKRAQAVSDFVLADAHQRRPHSALRAWLIT